MGESSIFVQFQAALASGDIVVSGILVFIAGFLTALSPCVYPIIPITLGVLGARRYHSAWHGLSVAGTYVLGMIVLYSGLGIIFASLGAALGGALQSPVVTTAIGLLLILYALFMFGIFEIALPQRLLNKMAKLGGRGFRGAFLMGLVAGIIAAPCTGPVLAFVLTLIAKDGDFSNGSSYMVLFGFGMGVPFLALSAFSTLAGSLPKSGSWMTQIKNSLALAMLVTAVYHLRFSYQNLFLLLSQISSLGLWAAAFLIILGLGLGSLSFSTKAKINIAARQGLGVIVMTIGLSTLLFGAPVERSDQWKVINANTKDAAAYFEQLRASATRQKKPMVVDFYADWCAACKEMEYYSYSNPAVAAELRRFELVLIDATNASKELKILEGRFAIAGFPTVLFIDSAGNLLEKRLVGFVDAVELRSLLSLVH